MSLKHIVMLVVSVPLLFASVSHAIVGVGFHWGNDLTLNMEDKVGEQLSFAKLSIDTNFIGGVKPADLGAITGKTLPLYVDRSDWERKIFNIGGKIFIDIIPLIDAVELSANYGVWEYMGQVRYPTKLKFKDPVSGTTPVTAPSAPDDIFDMATIVYDTLPVTLKEFDMEYLGLSKTPYMKLHFDMTIRKYIFRFPPKLNWFRLHAGAGTSLHFATPMLSKGLIEDALGELLNDTKNIGELATDLFGTATDNSKEVSKKIITEIVENMMTPHWGCHIDLGVMLKIPVAPIGIYIDGKFMIPFSDMDKGVDIGGYGLLLNSGISMTF